MRTTHSTGPAPFLSELLGQQAWSTLSEAVQIPSGLEFTGEDALDRAEAAMALGLVLLNGLSRRVAYARAYVLECAAKRRKLVFDHGAMRTVHHPALGSLAGRQAIARLLEPFGYVETKAYPLDRLGMTGFVYTHRDFPEELPQYFVSELYPELFSEKFQAATAELLQTTVDPLGEWAATKLATMQRTGELAREHAAKLIHAVADCFDRFHRDVTVEEYELFQAESPEMAWIATEGHAFNHITDRVDDVTHAAAIQRDRGRPVKESVEVSASGRVVQTALRAAEVDRLMRDGEDFVVRRVPGSFLEFISRERLQDGTLDLAFDAQNAQGIFKMTDGAQS